MLEIRTPCYFFLVGVVLVHGSAEAFPEVGVLDHNGQLDWARVGEVSGVCPRADAVRGGACLRRLSWCLFVCLFVF
jgi:hypothetical protein